VYYFRNPANGLFAFSLPPATDSAYINIISTNGKQGKQLLKQPEANMDLLHFSGLSFQS